MQDNISIIVEKLGCENIEKIQELYENFRQRSAIDYNFELMPLEFKNFKEIILRNLLEGFILFENSIAKGFLLYALTDYNSIELNLIHTIDNQDISLRKKTLLSSMLDEVKEKTGWNTISYPMLGIQQSFVRDITSLGFKMIGQSVVKFKFNQGFCRQIFKKAVFPELGAGYSISSWKDEYFEQACRIIYDTFKISNDACFDPRFATVEGSKDVVNKIVTSIYGSFLPEAVSVLLYNGKPEGICFANLTSPFIANIPLVGVVSNHKNKGYGKYLLKNSVETLIKYVDTGIISAYEVNATVDTDNFPALKMYRRIGFREDITYPHAYRCLKALS